jgi:hypothetical protein
VCVCVRHVIARTQLSLVDKAARERASKTSDNAQRDNAQRDKARTDTAVSVFDLPGRGACVCIACLQWCVIDAEVPNKHDERMSTADGSIRMPTMSGADDDIDSKQSPSPASAYKPLLEESTPAAAAVAGSDDTDTPSGRELKRKSKVSARSRLRSSISPLCAEKGGHC